MAAAVVLNFSINYYKALVYSCFQPIISETACHRCIFALVSRLTCTPMLLPPLLSMLTDPDGRRLVLT